MTMNLMMMASRVIIARQRDRMAVELLSLLTQRPTLVLLTQRPTLMLSTISLLTTEMTTCTSCARATLIPS